MIQAYDGRSGELLFTRRNFLNPELEGENAVIEEILGAVSHESVRKREFRARVLRERIVIVYRCNSCNVTTVAPAHLCPRCKKEDETSTLIWVTLEKKGLSRPPRPRWADIRNKKEARKMKKISYLEGAVPGVVYGEQFLGKMKKYQELREAEIAAIRREE